MLIQSLFARTVVAVAVIASPALADESFVPQISATAVQDAVTHAPTSDLLAMPLALADVASRQPSAGPAGNVAQVIQVGTANNAVVAQSGAGNMSLLMQQGSNNTAMISQTSRGR